MKIGDLSIAVQTKDGSDVTEELMTKLLDTIIDFVDENGCVIGGGFHLEDDEDNGEEEEFEDEWGELKPKERRNPPCGCHC